MARVEQTGQRARSAAKMASLLTAAYVAGLFLSDGLPLSAPLQGAPGPVETRAAMGMSREKRSLALSEPSEPEFRDPSGTCTEYDAHVARFKRSLRF